MNIDQLLVDICSVNNTKPTIFLFCKYKGLKEVLEEKTLRLDTTNIIIQNGFILS